MHRIAEWLEIKRYAEKDAQGRPMSQAAFARKLGISQATYWYMVNSGREPGPAVRDAIAKAYPDMPASLFLPNGLSNCDRTAE